MKDTTPALRFIEEQFISRCEAQGLPWNKRRPSPKTLQAQGHYYAGAMAALQALFGENSDRLAPIIPPTWVIDVMRGELIEPVAEKAEA